MLQWLIFIFLLPYILATLPEVKDLNITSPEITLIQEFYKHNHPLVRPVRNPATPVIVNVSFNLNELQYVDESLEQAMGILFLNFKWQNELFSWKPDEYEGISSLEAYPVNIWTPYLSYSKSRNDLSSNHHMVPLEACYNGLMWWIVGSVYETIMNIDLTNFPMDIQAIEVSVAYIAEDYRRVQLNIQNFPGLDTAFKTFSENGQWKVIGMNCEIQYLRIGDSPRTKLATYVVIQRKPLYYVINILIPVILFGLLSPFVFILPRSSGERIGFCITIFLSFSVLQLSLSQILPKTSAMPIIVYYIVFITVTDVVTLMVVVVNLRIHEKNTPPGSLWKNIANKMMDIMKKKKTSPYQLDVIKINENEQETQREMEITWPVISKWFDNVMFITIFSLNVIATLALCTILYTNFLKIKSEWLQKTNGCNAEMINIGST